MFTWMHVIYVVHDARLALCCRLLAPMVLMYMDSHWHEILKEAKGVIGEYGRMKALAQ